MPEPKALIHTIPDCLGDAAGRHAMHGAYGGRLQVEGMHEKLF